MKFNITLLTTIIIGSLNNFCCAMHGQQQLQHQAQQQRVPQWVRESLQKQSQKQEQRQRDSEYLLRRQAEYQQLYGKK